MTADEIRERVKQFGKTDLAGIITSERETILACELIDLLGEIAAQLAEANGNLRRIAGAIHMPEVI